MTEQQQGDEPWNEKAKAGDTVRLTITKTIEGLVKKPLKGGSQLYVQGYSIDNPDRTYEILSRAIPPLPNEPGTYWLDANNEVWWVTKRGTLCAAHQRVSPAAFFAPFRQLVVKEES